MRTNDQEVNGPAHDLSRPGPSSSRARASLLFVLLAVLLVALVTGCGGDAASDGGAPESIEVAEGRDGSPEKTELTFGISPTTQFAPVRVAIDEGFFEEEGVEVTTPAVTPRAAVPALLGGSLDFSGLNWTIYLTALRQDIPLSVISEGARGRPDLAQVLVPPDSDINTPEDLVGKKVATISTPGLCDAILLDVLQQSGVDGEPTFVEFPPLDIPGALERGDAEAGCVSEPFLSELKEGEGFSSVFDLFEDEYDDTPIVGYFTSTKFAEQNPNTVGAVQRALQKALEAVKKNPDLVRETLPTFAAMTPRVAQSITLPSYPDPTADLSSVDKLTELMERAGIFEEAGAPLSEPESAAGGAPAGGNG